MEENLIFKKFGRFLKENGAFSQFIYNFSQPRQTIARNGWIIGSGVFEQSNGSPNGLKDYFNKLKLPQEAINYAFRWVETEQGHMFWEDISDKWRREINNF